MKTLEVTTAAALIGKQITWSAPSASENKPYSGVCIITSVDLSSRRPIKSHTISGDNLDYAFYEKDSIFGDSLQYSDEGRFVTISL